MTPLREAMTRAMRQRGFSVRTQRSYLGAVSALARYYHRAPDRLDPDDLQRYFDHLVQERSLALTALRALGTQLPGDHPQRRGPDRAVGGGS